MSADFPAIERLSLLSLAMVARRYGEPVSQAIPQPAILLEAEFATEVLLIRHGRSADVVPGTAESEDPPLAEIGVAQADALARRLAAKPLAAIYSSDLRRARDTAAPIAAQRGLAINEDPELREVFLGDWERGEYRRRAAALDPEWIAHSRSGRWDTVPGSEGDDAFRRRVTTAVDRGIAAHEGTSIAVVCHGGVINAVLASIWGAHSSFLIPTENTGITVVRAGASRKIVITVNDCHHLYDPVLGVAA
jgi:probable phosphoglycerate mutase